MDFRYQRQLLFSLFLICFFYSKASHIVGGVMNYRYLGSNNFEISLYVYRDDVRANPNAFLDDPAIIRVYNGTTESQFDFSLPFDSFLPLGQIDPCATIAITERIDWTKYRGTINLPPNANGYTIYYQRCCRNNSIANITKDPISNTIEWGATYSINIPPAVNGQYVNNSSPVFLNYPPVYICVNKPITYNHAATDANGDRIVYSLCTPFTGADVDDPLNNGSGGQLPNDEPPPFTNIQWRSPYSLSNVLGGIPLTINSSTGVLSGTPNTIGQFVVGVCAEEYRNGVLLTRTLRDFQFNVVDCGLRVISSFFAPSFQCNNLTVNFTNTSFGASTYKWYFGDGDSSTLQNPSHTYAAAGNYTVTLVCNQGESCNSTSTQVLNLRIKRVEANFTAQNTSCLKQGDTIRFTDQSIDAVNINQWKWSFSNGSTSTVKNPFIIYNGTSTSITATLTVSSADSCSSSITKTINLVKKPAYTLTRSYNKCKLETIQLGVNIAGNNVFSWTPTTGLNNPNIANPTSTTPVNTTYYVTIKTIGTNGDTCVQKDSVKVNIVNNFQINAIDTIKVCKDSIRLSVTTTAGQTVTWSTSNTFTPVIGTTPNISVAQTVPIRKYYVKVISNGCEGIDSVVAIYSDTIPKINLIDNILQCSKQVNLSANIDFSESIVWSTSPTFTPVISTTNTYNTTQNPKTVIYYIKANFRNCSNKDSVKVTIQDTLPQITLADTLNICKDVVRLNATVTNFTSVVWSTSPSFSPVIGTTPSITLNQTNPRQVYYIKAAYRNCEKTDSIVVNYSDTIPKINLIDNILQCSKQVNLSANIDFSESIVWSTSPTFTPVISTTNTYNTTQNPKTVIYYIKANFRNCSNKDSVKVTIQDTLPQITLADTLNVCKDVVRLNATVNNFTSVIWSTSPSFSPIIGTTPSITINQTNIKQVYYIKAAYRDCEKIDSIVVNYSDIIPAIQLDDSAFFCGNKVSANATVINATSVVWSVNESFTPVLSSQNSFTATQNDSLKTYYIKANFRFCPTTDSIRIRVQNRLPQIAIADSVFVCADSVRLVGRITNYDSVKWSYEPTFTNVFATTPSIIVSQTVAEEMYYVKVFYLECEVIDSFRVLYNDTTPKITLSSPKRFCSDSVFAYAFVDFYTSLEWYDGNDLSHLIGTNLTLQITQPQGKKWYYFKANYKYCSSIDSIELENVSIKYSKQNVAVCDGKQATLNLNVQTPSQYDILWYANNDTSETNNISTLSLTPINTQTVVFSISNLFGCKVDDSLQITINPTPTIDASVDKPVIYRGEQVQLNATQNQGYSYNWTPANAVSNTTIYNPISSPLQNTLYTVNITDANQCLNQDTVSVQVLDYQCSVGQIFIPNAFTPNGDGINDEFKVRSNILRIMHLEIYNRWGNKVFETDDINKGWDGNYKDKLDQVEVYGYYFIGECIQGERITLKGNITLIK